MTIASPDVETNLNWTIDRAGKGHGLVVWFDADLLDGAGFSNAPGAPEAIYGNLFSPWPQPIVFSAGDTVNITLTAKLLESDYVWRWTTCAQRTNDGPVKFDQSSLQGAVLSPEKLRKAASDYIPQLSEEGLLDRRILEFMDSGATLEEIARKLVAEFPQQFSRWQDALSNAGAVSKLYSR